MAPKSVPVPMITRVRLKNFRSIAECDVELGPLTILVGPNGSGKSNFFGALNLVSDALENGLETALEARGRLDSLIHRAALQDSTALLRFDIQLSLPQRWTGRYVLSLRRTDGGGHEIEEERCTVHLGGTPPKFEEFVVSDAERRWTTTRGLDVDSEMWLTSTALSLPFFADHVHFGALYRALRGMDFYSLHVSEMRRPRVADSGERLLEDGGNVASVLRRLARQNTRGWSPRERIVDFLAATTAGIEDVYTTNVDTYEAIRVRQRADDRADSWIFNATEVSYGTLRTLGVLVALYQGSMAGGSPVTLVGIEEPESAVHPAAVAAILEAMDEASLTTQVLATTHSSSMLDYEDLDLDAVRAVSLRSGSTTIGPVDAVSKDVVRRHLYTAGELLRMGQIRPDREEAAHDESLAAAPHS